MLDKTQTTISRATPSPSPMDAVVHAAAEKLLTLRMAKLTLEPEQDDLDNVFADLEILVQIFDYVIKGYGEYAGSYFGMSQKQIRDYFHDQVRGTIDGNATWALEEAYRENAEARDNQLWERR